MSKTTTAMFESAKGPLKTNMFFAKLKPKAMTLIKVSWESGALWSLMLAEFMYMKKFNLDLNVLHVPTFSFTAACSYEINSCLRANSAVSRQTAITKETSVSVEPNHI